MTGFLDKAARTLLLLGLIFFFSRLSSAEEARDRDHAVYLKIGVAVPLSGDFAKFGVDVQRGMLMAQEEFAGRDVPLQLIFEDTQYQPRLAATAAKKLIDRDRIDVIVSLWDTAEAVAPIAEQAKIPHFSIRWNPRVAEEFAHTFTFESTYITWTRELVRFLKSTGIRRLALMTDISGAAWVMTRDSFLKEAALARMEIINDVQFSGMNDLQIAVTKLSAKPADYIVMLHYEPTLSDAMRRLKTMGIAVPVTGFFEGMEGAEFEGRRFVAQFDTQPWFYEKFFRKYPAEKPIKAAFGYDLVSILGKLAERVRRRPSSNEILAHLNQLRGYQGATGTISANTTRNIETTCVQKEIRNGAARVIAPNEERVTK